MISNVSKLFRKLYVRKKQGKFVKVTANEFIFKKKMQLEDLQLY